MLEQTLLLEEPGIELLVDAFNNDNHKKSSPQKFYATFFSVNVLLRYQLMDDCFKVCFLYGKIDQFVC